MSEMKPPTKETANYSRFGELGWRPDKIEEQEVLGASEVVEYDSIPTNGCSTDQEIESFTNLGFEIHAVFSNDELFRGASLPPGWKKRPTGHNMWTEIVDETGKKRFSIFYKAASYDRDAFIRATS